MRYRHIPNATMGLARIAKFSQNRAHWYEQFPSQAHTVHLKCPPHGHLNYHPLIKPRKCLAPQPAF